MRVRFVPQARAQYLEALSYVRAQSPAAADGIQLRAEAVIVQLSAHPRSGHAILEFPDLPHLEIPVEPYRFFYRIIEGAVWIVGVWHARQLPEPPDATMRG
ncbi:MAG: type II toxin-antitoxin system RelE/ParE family toxin [Coriobacteriia bacterium]|nr:type II toxin-antitoxin system RelE/ParE family toxin [Coriobacteriia bacterium]